MNRADFLRSLGLLAAAPVMVGWTRSLEGVWYPRRSVLTLPVQHGGGHSWFSVNLPPEAADVTLNGLPMIREDVYSIIHKRTEAHYHLPLDGPLHEMGTIRYTMPDPARTL